MGIEPKMSTRNIIFKTKNLEHRGFFNKDFELVSKIVLDSQFFIRTRCILLLLNKMETRHQHDNVDNQNM